MNARGTDISNASQKRDMYLALYNSQKQLVFTSTKKDIKRDFLIEQSEYFTHKSKDGCNYNLQINDMCALFIDIGLEIVLADQVADFGYDAYMRAKGISSIF